MRLEIGLICESGASAIFFAIRLEVLYKKKPPPIQEQREIKLFCLELDSVESLVEVVDDVFVVFRTDGEADRCRRNTCSGEFFRSEFRVGRGVRVHHQALHVGHVSEQAENLEAVDELEGFGLAALHVEREDGTAAIREVAFVKLVVRMVLEARVVDLRHLRVLREEFENLLGIFHMAVKAERKRFGALEQEEGVERGNRGTFVTQENGADIDDIGSGACSGRERHAVTRIHFGELRELARCSPVKLAAVNNHAAERGTVTADELGGGVDHDIGTVFQRANQVRSTEGIVDKHRNLVLVGDFRNRLDVRDVGMRVAERLDEHELRVFLDGSLDFFEVAGVHERGIDAERAERMLQEVVGTAVDGALGNHVVTLAGEGSNGISEGCRTGSDSEASDTAFESGDALFKNVLRGVGKTAVDVARILQVETIRGMLGAVENVGGGLVNRNRAGIGGGIGLFLANVELKRFEVEFVLCRHGLKSFFAPSAQWLVNLCPIFTSRGPARRI